MEDRVILHCDMNNFFASVECLGQPDLAKKPVVVAGRKEERRGVVLAKNEVAKAFGVRTGQALWEAQRSCPELVVLPPHYQAYMHYSMMARRIYAQYTDQVEPFGLDECWLDVTGSVGLFGSGEQIARRIQEQVRQETGGLTISVGVSFNKVFAKLGSDLKKPDAITCIPREAFRQKLWHLPAQEMLGVGPATAARLARYGIRTIGDLAGARVEFLRRLLGVCGGQLWLYANGMDESVVARAEQLPPMKSVGHGTTCRRDLDGPELAGRVFLQLSQEVSRRLIQAGLAATKVQIAVRDNRMRTVQFQGRLECPTQNALELTLRARELLAQNYRWELPVRALSLRAEDLVTELTPQQVSFFSDWDRHIKREDIATAVYALRNRFGPDSVTPASLMLDPLAALPHPVARDSLPRFAC